MPQCKLCVFRKVLRLFFVQRILVKLFFVQIAGTLSLMISACDPAELAYGRPVPTARIEVFLREPSTRYELFNRFQELAKAARFEKAIHAYAPTKDYDSLSLIHSFQWNSVEGVENFPQSIGFILPRDTKYPSNFTFTLSRWSPDGDGFSEVEWRAFVKFRDETLPHYFGSAEIVVKRHPAVHTNFENLEAISRAANEPIPKRILTEYEVWRAKQKMSN